MPKAKRKSRQIKLRVTEAQHARVKAEAKRRKVTIGKMLLGPFLEG